MLRVIYLEARSIEYYKRGGMKKGKLLFDTEINGIKYQGGEWISFHENGRVKCGTLAKGNEMDGITFGGGEEIHFNENKRVENGTITKYAIIDDIEPERDEGRDYYTFIPLDTNQATFFSKIKKMFKR